MILTTRRMTIKAAIGSSIFKIRSLSTFDSPTLLLSASSEFSDTAIVIVFVPSSPIFVSPSSFFVSFVVFVYFFTGEGVVVVMTVLKVNDSKL